MNTARGGELFSEMQGPRGQKKLHEAVEAVRAVREASQQNFICNEVAGEELWEKVGAVAMSLAYSSETKVMSLDLTHFIDLVDLAAL